MDRSLAIYEEVVRLDPEFADAYLNMANTALAYYRTYDRSPAIIEKVREYLDKASQVMGESKEVLWVRGILARTTGDPEASLIYLERAIELDPDFPQAHEAIAMTCALLGKVEKAVHARESWIRIQPDDRNARFSFLMALNKVHDTPRLRQAARDAMSIFERYLRLSPDDLYTRSQYVGVLCMAGETERGLAEGKKLEATGELDGYVLCNIGCAYLHVGDIEHGLETIIKCVKSGYRNMDVFHLHPDLDCIRDRPEFAEIMKEMEKS
jgi:tetratricopeptide (TPR) repeat protein